MGCNHTVLRYLAHGPAEMFRMVGVERGRSHEDPPCHALRCSLISATDVIPLEDMSLLLRVTGRLAACTPDLEQVACDFVISVVIPKGAELWRL